jgi:hypothetical protein
VSAASSGCAEQRIAGLASSDKFTAGQRERGADGDGQAGVELVPAGCPAAVDR